ncbi:MAG: DUF3667 domain-containing protein, partial [Lysobacterales bacterium]
PGQARYCPACGQSVKVIKRPWQEVVSELATELLDVDGRMLRSLWNLLVHPGYLSNEYINGRRVSHTSPLRMYLVISLVFFFALPAILPDSGGAQAVDQLPVEQYSRAMFLLMPVFALVMKVFYRRAYYLEHLVFTLYLFSAMFIVFGLMLPIEAAADRYLAVMLVQLALLAYALAYLIVALRVTYRESWLKTSLKSVALLFISMMMVSGVFFGIDFLKPGLDGPLQ